jgi:hypothetical protein
MAIYFFDSSALVKRYHPETGTADVKVRKKLVPKLIFVVRPLLQFLTDRHAES